MGCDDICGDQLSMDDPSGSIFFALFGCMLDA
jgi:hypothetical protein